MNRSRVVRLVILLTLIATAAFALERQPNQIYRARREALAKKANGAPIVVFATTESDLTEVLTGFRQDEDFWYLTGVNEPGAAVLIVPALDAEAVKAANAQLPPGRPPTLKPRPYSEVLLLPQRNHAAERWTGPKLGPGDADAKTGFDRVVPLDALREEIANVISPLGGVVLVNQGKDSKLALDWLKRGNLSVYSRDVKPLIASLRVVKDTGEIELIRKATDASVEAHLAAWKAIKPGTGERQIAALMVYEFERRGCERPAYGPIVGSGFHSTVLHYDEDSGPINDGDIIVMDVGGEYSMYATDITRTVPANGRFTPRQREIYDIVLGAQQAAIRAFKSGKSLLGGRDENSLFMAAYEYINSHGKDLHGQPLGQYLIHGISHMVGLNVHDPGYDGKAVGPGMVFTIEPGIYIPEESLGVRIEDTFLVDAQGNLVNLSGNLPKSAEEIEKLMAK
ncbi:MAG: aminopeptidase P N-terminal domain-containing protein [Acidobacteriia bacterium]|nr:aminopeptidase P N-terminal domain-containing protein [Terriglobia bacterium]